MSYELQYDLQSIRIIKNPKIKQRMRIGFMIFTLVIGSLLGHIFSILLQTTVLTPSENTTLAADQMAESIRNGESVADALETFCEALPE